MKLKSFHIGNFKSFGPVPQEIPLKPLTLVFGPNSSGKSSIIHSILWLNHAIETDSFDVFHPTRGEGKVDLGGFQQVLNRGGDAREINSGFEFQISKNIEDQEPQSPMRLMTQDRVGFTFSIGNIRRNAGLKTIPEVRTASIMIDGDELLRLTADGSSNRLKVNLLNLEHPALFPFMDQGAQNLNALSPRAIEDHLNDLVLSGEMEVTCAGLFPEALKILTTEKSNFGKDTQTSKLENDFSRLIRDLFLDIGHEGSKEIRDLVYLPPLRDLPERSFDLAKSESEVWRNLVENSEVREAVNKWLSSDFMKTRYSIEVREMIPLDRLEMNLPNDLYGMLTKLLSNPHFTAAYQELLPQLEHQYQNTNWDDYVGQHPALMDELIELEKEVYANTSELLDDDLDWEDFSEKKQTRIARESVEGHLSTENGYDEYLGHVTWPFFLQNHDELTELLSTHWDQNIAGREISRKLQAGGIDRRKELVLKQMPNQVEVSLQDVGVGISQVLPVLISAIANREKLIAIEQPEIHIHPALQSELGDLFIESALGDRRNTFLIETHSEHLLLRLLKRVRETTRKHLPEGGLPVTLDDISVLYVNPSDDGATIRQLRIDSQGQFIDDWPNGFFEERFDELF